MKNNKQNPSQGVVMGPSKDFELIKKLDENGVEYWTARELLLVLGYSKWQRFEEVINRAKQSCVNSRQFPQDHFTDAGKMVGIGSNTVRKVGDYKLDRYACYLVAQNGDPENPQIATVKSYFILQTIKREIADKARKTLK